MPQNLSNTIRPRITQVPTGPDTENNPLGKWLLVLHQITREEYDFRKELFFKNSDNDGITPPDDIQIPMTEIRAQLPQLQYGFKNVVFKVDVNDASNNDIELLPVVPPDPLPEHFIAFSVNFFQALCSYFQDADTLHVTKAISPIGGPEGRSIAFRLTKSDGTKETTLFCADLSGVYP